MADQALSIVNGFRPDKVVHSDNIGTESRPDKISGRTEGNELIVFH
jgi:hypothetical protein